MTKPGVLRIEIFPDLIPALRVEAAIRGIKERELVNKLILEGLSSRALEFRSVPQTPKPPRSKIRGRADTPEVEKTIKEHYGKPISEIARITGIPKTTMLRKIKRMEDAGELKPAVPRQS